MIPSISFIVNLATCLAAFIIIQAPDLGKAFISEQDSNRYFAQDVAQRDSPMQSFLKQHQSSARLINFGNQGRSGVKDVSSRALSKSTKISQAKSVAKAHQQHTQHTQHKRVERAVGSQNSPVPAHCDCSKYLQAVKNLPPIRQVLTSDLRLNGQGKLHKSDTQGDIVADGRSGPNDLQAIADSFFGKSKGEVKVRPQVSEQDIAEFEQPEEVAEATVGGQAGASLGGNLAGSIESPSIGFSGSLAGPIKTDPGSVDVTFGGSDNNQASIGAGINLAADVDDETGNVLSDSRTKPKQPRNKPFGMQTTVDDSDSADGGLFEKALEKAEIPRLVEEIPEKIVTVPVQLAELPEQIKESAEAFAEEGGAKVLGTVGKGVEEVKKKVGVDFLEKKKDKIEGFIEKIEEKKEKVFEKPTEKPTEEPIIVLPPLPYYPKPIPIMKPQPYGAPNIPYPSRPMFPVPEQPLSFPLVQSPNVEMLPQKCKFKVKELEKLILKLLILLNRLDSKIMSNSSTVSYMTRDVLIHQIALIKTAAEESRMAANIGNLKALTESARTAGIELVRLSSNPVAVELEPGLRSFSISLRRAYGFYRKSCRLAH